MKFEELTKIINAQLRVGPLPLPPAVLAAVLIRVLKTLAYDAPDEAQAGLYNLWQSVRPALLEKYAMRSHPFEAALIVILESYFKERGDWSKMEAWACEFLPADGPVDWRQLIASLEKDMMEQRKLCKEAGIL